VEVPDAGTASLVAETAFELGNLDARRKDELLEIPSAWRQQGRVRGWVDGRLTFLESELTLTPRMSEAQLRAIVVNSSQAADAPPDGGTSVNLDMQLNPNLSYDLSILPRLDASKQLPPYRSTEYNPHDPLNVEYGVMVAHGARLVPSTITTTQRVRLEEKITGQVVSSVEEVDRPETDAGVTGTGTFTLYATQEVFNEASKHNLVVGLDSVGDSKFPRWQVTIKLDGTRLTGTQNPLIDLPKLPPATRVEGFVEHAETANTTSPTRAPSADLEFVSEFPWLGEGYFGAANWCSLRPDQPSPGLSCSARLRTRTESDGHFSIDLLPGKYRVFVQPDRTASPDRATQAQYLTVEAEPPGNLILYVPEASKYSGLVLSTQGQPMPNVTFSARALGLYDGQSTLNPKPDDLNPQLARYNRNISVVTNQRGQYSLYPDVGYYDFTVETPSESGFAWMLCPEYLISPRDEPEPISLAPFKPPHPVILAGTVEHKGVKLPNARIEAYAVWNTKPPRRLMVARGVSNSEGKFRLSMPPQLPPPDLDDRPYCPIDLKPPASVSSMDAGLSATLDSALSER
jgi:hypothetical protein